MIRVLTFEGYDEQELLDPNGEDSPRGAVRFQMIYEALFLATPRPTQPMTAPPPRSTADRKLNLKAQQLLQSIGVPFPERAKALDGRVGKVRRLKPEGGTISFDQDVHDHLVKQLEGVDWMPALDEAFVDALQFLNAADKVDSPR
jgi:hypothetical protein